MISRSSRFHRPLEHTYDERIFQCELPGSNTPFTGSRCLSPSMARCRCAQQAPATGHVPARTCPPRILATATVVRGVDRRSSTTADHTVAIACNARHGANGRNYTPIPPIRIVLTAHIPSSHDAACARPCQADGAWRLSSLWQDQHVIVVRESFSPVCGFVRAQKRFTSAPRHPASTL